MPIACQSYYTVRERLSAFLVGVSKPQLTNLSLLVFGLFAAGNCQLPRIAAKLPLRTGSASLTQRLRRLLRNEAIEPTILYQPIARFLLAAFRGGNARLILDAKDLGGRFPVLFVAVAYRGRALPLAWRMLPAPGGSEFAEQKALLLEVAAQVPPSVTVTLGFSELRAKELRGKENRLPPCHWHRGDDCFWPILGFLPCPISA